MASAIKERFIVAAIDFGTTFSGYAYSFYSDFKDDPLKIFTNSWTNTTTGVKYPFIVALKRCPDSAIHPVVFT